MPDVGLGGVCGVGAVFGAALLALLPKMASLIRVKMLMTRS
jgi:hypothetical protein